ncbi:hypothetical protein H257_09647 [Aphanomyces astaci]|uniref:Core-binding (CB) domain-containing protein n=1 Tax=Aphanomyces astaci TaxID=112090 RepID=W4GB01_APHAT|nr:hypothetical protein H257_09647 [Aphanomyces astaci]ETV76113.1 hypothetical protein H257_09647 [Aphanomyces astaci]|eukprot:XP_009834238.1 hypothetical protein H257_09647 [Aphanomyces astaci]
MDSGMNENRQHATLDSLIDNQLSESTKICYNSKLNQVVEWVKGQSRYELLKDDGSLDLNNFQYSDFMDFAVWKYKHSKCRVDMITVWKYKHSKCRVDMISGYRSAMRYYFEREGVEVPQALAKRTIGFLKGMRRECSLEAQEVGMDVVGKRPVDYSQYVVLCHVRSDAIGIVFCKSKTDQSGTKRRDPRHIYSNPMEARSCVFRAIAIYLACHPQLSMGKLFPGAAQKDRFGKQLAKLLSHPDTTCGRSEYGTHSIRKVLEARVARQSSAFASGAAGPLGMFLSGTCTTKAPATSSSDG